MPWGSYLHTGSVDLKVKGRPIRENVGQWRDQTAQPVSPGLARAGENHVRAHVRDLVIVGSRPTTPPPCHTETPSA